MNDLQKALGKDQVDLSRKTHETTPIDDYRSVAPPHNYIQTSISNDYSDMRDSPPLESYCFCLDNVDNCTSGQPLRKLGNVILRSETTVELFMRYEILWMN